MHDHVKLYDKLKHKVMSRMNRGFSWLLLGWLLVAGSVLAIGDIGFFTWLIAVPANMGIMFLTYILQMVGSIRVLMLINQHVSTYTLGPADLSSIRAMEGYLERDVRKSKLAKLLYVLCSINITYVSLKFFLGV